jgi:chromosome segregation ATPase
VNDVTWPGAVVPGSHRPGILWPLRQHQNLLGQTALELDRSENRIVFSRQRAQELATRRQQLTAEIEQASAQRAQLESRATAHRAAVTALQNELAGLESVLATLTAACSQIAGSQQSAEDRIAHLRRTAADLADG